MKLTDAKIASVRLKGRPKKLFDGRGLYVLANPNGSRWWRFKYRYAGLEKCISLGVYPEVSIKKARALCEDARALLRDGRDPSAERQEQKYQASLAQLIRVTGVDEAHLGFDELLATRASIHIERMSPSHIWLSVTKGPQTVTLNLNAVKGRLRVRVEDEAHMQMLRDAVNKLCEPRS